MRILSFDTTHSSCRSEYDEYNRPNIARYFISFNEHLTYSANFV